jgi:uncharacterized protein
MAPWPSGKAELCKSSISGSNPLGASRPSSDFKRAGHFDPPRPMIIGTARITLFLPENYSLKDKRQDLKPLLSRTMNQFHVAAAEVADNDNWQRATIGVACVSSDARHANEIISRVVRFIEGNLQEGGLEDYEVEIIHLS